MHYHATPLSFDAFFREPAGISAQTLHCHKLESLSKIRAADSIELVKCPRYRNVTDGQTDRMTDGRTTYDSNTTLALYVHRTVMIAYMFHFDFRGFLAIAQLCFFYHAMHVVLTRYCNRKSSVCPSVCLGVCPSMTLIGLP